MGIIRSVLMPLLASVNAFGTDVSSLHRQRGEKKEINNGAQQKKVLAMAEKAVKARLLAYFLFLFSASHTAK